MLDWQREEQLISFGDLPDDGELFNFKGWKSAFTTRLLLSGVRGHYDERSPRLLNVGEEYHSVFLKYQMPTFDVACHEETGGLIEGVRSAYDQVTLLVRVSGFINGERDEVPPFVFAMPCEALMFHAQTRGIPVPLVFSKVAAGEPSQPIVQYRSG